MVQTIECANLVVQIPEIIFSDNLASNFLAVLSAFKTLAIFVIARSTPSAMSVEDEEKNDVLACFGRAESCWILHMQFSATFLILRTSFSQFQRYKIDTFSHLFSLVHFSSVCILFYLHYM